MNGFGDVYDAEFSVILWRCQVVPHGMVLQALSRVGLCVAAQDLDGPSEAKKDDGAGAGGCGERTLRLVSVGGEHGDEQNDSCH